ncbi:hypothetical protein ACFLV2_03135 [Chloroflexota bacterium]
MAKMLIIRNRYFWFVSAFIAVLGVFYYASDIPAINWLAPQPAGVPQYIIRG